MSRRFLTAEDVRRAGASEIVVDAGTVVTPQAQELAASLGVSIRTPSGGYTEPQPDRGPDAEEEVLHPHLMPEPSDEHMGSGVIVTCVGCNRPGVMAEVAGAIGQHDANISDVSQKMVGEYFHLVLVVDLGPNSDFAAMKESLMELDRQVEYVIRVMHERVFRFMHRV